MGASRFRPLAGFWFLNIDRFRMFARAASVFPSPCGVLVLKCEYYHANNTEENRFRPLAGFPYLSFPRRYGGSGEQREPMGALVPCVHFCRYGWFTACVHGAPSGTLRVPPPPLWQGRLEIRSVPLRGSGS